MPIVEYRRHLHRQRLPRQRRGVRRRNLDVIDPRILFLRAGRAAGDPFGEDFVFRRIHLEPLAALVRDQLRRLEQDQAARGIVEIDPAPLRGFGDGEVIALVIIAAQRKLEAPLPRRRAVARPGRTAVAREDRLDFVAERRRGIRRGAQRRSQHPTSNTQHPTSNGPTLHQNSSLIGSNPRSMMGNGRPCGPGSSVSRSMPSER